MNIQKHTVKILQIAKYTLFNVQWWWFDNDMIYLNFLNLCSKIPFLRSSTNHYICVHFSVMLRRFRNEIQNLSLQICPAIFLFYYVHGLTYGQQKVK